MFTIHTRATLKKKKKAYQLSLGIFVFSPVVVVLIQLKILFKKFDTQKCEIN